MIDRCSHVLTAFWQHLTNPQVPQIAARKLRAAQSAAFLRHCVSQLVLRNLPLRGITEDLHIGELTETQLTSVLIANHMSTVLLTSIDGVETIESKAVSIDADAERGSIELADAEAPPTRPQLCFPFGRQCAPTRVRPCARTHARTHSRTHARAHARMLRTQARFGTVRRGFCPAGALVSLRSKIRFRSHSAETTHQQRTRDTSRDISA